MTRNLRIAARAGAALVGALIALAQANPARAGCNIDDIVNAIVGTVSTSLTSACISACGTGGTGSCTASVLMTGALFAAAGATSDNGGQANVNSFCSEMNNLLNPVSSGVKDAKSVVSALQAAGINVSQDLVDALNDAASPIAVAKCACGSEQSLNQLGADAGACLQDFACGIQSLWGQYCSCTPVPPIFANCSQSLTQCNCLHTANNNQCANQPACLGQVGVPILTDDPFTKTPSSAGTLVTVPGGKVNAQFCPPTALCFCPLPMVPTWTPDESWAAWNAWSGNVSAGTPPPQIFSCNCPAGSDPDPSGATVNGISVCVCNNTGNPIMAGYAATLDNPCPTPLVPPNCPVGQPGPNCTPTCPQGQTVRPDGTCCDPLQVTSCGKCCPSGTTPDPVSGGCNRPPQIQ